VLSALRYYWIAAKGYRLRPWKSPYLRWRFETFLGHEAAELDAKKFFALLWKYRAQMKSFLRWADERRREQRAPRRR
jgi:3-phenylpropionate/cinnamic acid dioxygenase small subunit